MQFIKTALWVILAVALALFCKANWISVPIKLWGDTVADTKLPVLVVSAFLLGLLPMWVFARIARWRIRRRLDSAEQALAATAPSVAALPVEAIVVEPALPYSTPSEASEEASKT